MHRLLIPLLLLATATSAQDIGPKVDELLDAYAKLGQFSGSVLVAKGGKVYAKGVGMANYELNVPNAPKTKFRLGSITKQFTAACILMLQEEDKLSVDDLVSKHLDTPPAWKAITIRHLLTHSSGIVNFTDLWATPSNKRGTMTTDELIKTFRDKPLEFTPGEKFKYCNSGYVVLTAIIEKLSGKRYADFVHDRIFVPLDMKDTMVESQDEITLNRASGYRQGPHGILNCLFIDMTLPSGAGDLISTVEDMYKWDRAQYTEKLIKKASMAQMLTPFKDNYGFGVVSMKLNGKQVVVHDGGIDGFHTTYLRLPDDDTCVILLSNFEHASLGPLRDGLVAILSGGNAVLPKEHKAITLPSATLEKYVGTYEMTKAFSIVVTRDGDHLFGQATGQGKVEMFPESETMFFLTVVDAQIEFTKDGLILHQGGQNSSAKKVK